MLPKHKKTTKLFVLVFCQRAFTYDIQNKKNDGSVDCRNCASVIPKHEKTTLCPRYGVPTETVFLDIWPKRTYLQRLPVNKRIIRASIESGEKW